MKTFKDLKFEPHKHGNGLQAILFFPNGYGISVVRFKLMAMYGSYTDNDLEWECAILFGNDKEWELTYNTPITDDVIGHLTEEQVTELMEKIQLL